MIPSLSQVRVPLLRWLASIAVAVPAVFGARDARAAGTALDVQSARGTGMAAAVTAMIDDSSAIYYNPAGIAQGRVLDAQIGDSLILPSYRFTPPGGSSTANGVEVVPPFTAYVSGGLTRDFSIGIGVFEPYGSTVKWPEEWIGKSVITSSQLATYDINPTAAYRFGPLRVGVGFQLVRATVDLKQKVETGSSEGATELGADAWGAGANVGIQVDAIKKYLSLGAHYRSAVKLDFDGHAHFANVPRDLETVLHDQAASTSLVNPDSLAVAAAIRPIERFVLDAEVAWFGWSKFHAIDIRFPNDTSRTLDRHEPKNWSNTLNYRVGGEFAINDTWRVRAGVLYDPSPSPADTLLPDIPDADRLNLAAGASYLHASGFRIDLGYQFLVLFRRTSTAPTLPGHYSGFVDILGLSVGYRTPKNKSMVDALPASTTPAEEGWPPPEPSVAAAPSSQ